LNVPESTTATERKITFSYSPGKVFAIEKNVFTPNPWNPETSWTRGHPAGIHRAEVLGPRREDDVEHGVQPAHAQGDLLVMPADQEAEPD